MNTWKAFVELGAYIEKHAQILLHHREFGDKLEDLRYEIKRQQDALEWYADEKNYNQGRPGDVVAGDFIMDNGFRARQVLGNEYSHRRT